MKIIIYTVTYEFVAGKYTALKIDRKIEEPRYTHAVIDGFEYKLVPTYDMPLCIGIEAQGGFLGKKVEIR